MEEAFLKLKKIDEFIEKKYRISDSRDFKIIKLYADAVYDFLVHYCTYDSSSASIVKANNNDTEIYNRLLNLKNCVLTGKGVCGQFAQFFTTLVANRIYKVCGKARCGILNAKIYFTDKNGNNKIDPHSLNFLSFDGRLYLYDISMGLKQAVKAQEPNAFCGIDSELYQTRLAKFDNNSTIESTNMLYIEPKPMKAVFELFYPHKSFYIKKTEDYEGVKAPDIFTSPENY